MAGGVPDGQQHPAVGQLAALVPVTADPGLGRHVGRADVDPPRTEPAQWRDQGLAERLGDPPLGLRLPAGPLGVAERTAEPRLLIGDVPRGEQQRLGDAGVLRLGVRHPAQQPSLTAHDDGHLTVGELPAGQQGAHVPGEARQVLGVQQPGDRPHVGLDLPGRGDGRCHVLGVLDALRQRCLEPQQVTHPLGPADPAGDQVPFGPAHPAALLDAAAEPGLADRLPVGQQQVLVGQQGDGAAQPGALQYAVDDVDVVDGVAGDGAARLQRRAVDVVHAARPHAGPGLGQQLAEEVVGAALHTAQLEVVGADDGEVLGRPVRPVLGPQHGRAAAQHPQDGGQPGGQSGQDRDVAGRGGLRAVVGEGVAGLPPRVVPGLGGGRRLGDPDPRPVPGPRHGAQGGPVELLQWFLVSGLGWWGGTVRRRGVHMPALSVPACRFAG